MVRAHTTLIIITWTFFAANKGSIKINQNQSKSFGREIISIRAVSSTSRICFQKLWTKQRNLFFRKGEAKLPNLLNPLGHFWLFFHFSHISHDPCFSIITNWNVAGAKQKGRKGENSIIRLTQFAGQSEQYRERFNCLKEVGFDFLSNKK